MLLKVLTFLGLASVAFIVAQFTAWDEFTQSVGSSVGRATYGVDLTTYLQGYTDTDATNQYAGLFTWSWLSAVIVMSVYYLAIDTKRYQDTKYWVLALLVSGLVPAIKAFTVAQTGIDVAPELAEVGLSSAFVLALVTFLFAVVLAVVLSFLIRLASTNCRLTPRS